MSRATSRFPASSSLSLEMFQRSKFEHSILLQFEHW